MAKLKKHEYRKKSKKDDFKKIKRPETKRKRERIDWET